MLEGIYLVVYALKIFKKIHNLIIRIAYFALHDTCLVYKHMLASMLIATMVFEMSSSNILDSLWIHFMNTHSRKVTIVIDPTNGKDLPKNLRICHPPYP